MQISHANTSWESKAAAKRSSTNAKIPQEWQLSNAELEKAAKQKDLTGSFIEQYLTPDEGFIVAQDANKLAENIRSGEWTAKTVAQAFCKSAAIAHQIDNCLHEIFFDQAISRAEELDAYYKVNGKTIGPLHGVPVSLKDQFHVKGNDTSMGYIGWIGTYQGSTDKKLVHNVDSQIVSELLSLGVVLFCKTSLPQGILITETINNLIGRTMNPYNQNLSAGGSSGGEGALQALRGSPVGLGTDIGGSVRIPAAFNGLFALKPSYGRLSYRDVGNVIPGQTTYRSSIGILGRSIESLYLVLTSVLSTEPWLRDPYVVPLPWRQQLVDTILEEPSVDGAVNPGRPLKLGIFWTDNVVTPHPPITRGLKIVVDAVKRAGHKVVPWDPPEHSTAKRIHASFLKADGRHDIHKQLDLSGEPLIPQTVEKFALTDPISVTEYHNLTLQGIAYETAYSDYWNSTGVDDGQLVDAVIMPAAPHAGVLPGKFFHATYTAAINVLDYSAVVIPVTKANASIDKADPNYMPLNETDEKNWNAYDADIFDGAPVGVQIVARKFEEEKIWAIGKLIYQALLAERNQ